LTLLLCAATIAAVPEVAILEKPARSADAKAILAPAKPPTPRTVWWAVLVAFVLRYGWVLIAHKYRFTLPTHYDFGEEMGAVARSIVTGRGFSSPFPELSGPTTWVAPVYPLLIAAVFKIFGLYSTASALVMLALNSAFSALTCWPMYLVGRELTSRRVAMYSMWLWAIVPQFMHWAINWIWDAALTGLVLTTFVLVALRMSRSATRRQWMGFGLAWGLAALLNPTLLSVLPFMVLYIGWHARRRGEAWVGRAVLCCLLVVLVVTPWLVRNYFAFGKFVFIRGNFWAEMRYGNAIYGDGTEMGFTHPEVNMYERKKYLTLGEQGYFDWKKRDTLEFIRTYPKYFAELCGRRVLLFWWDFDDVSGYTDWILLAMGRRIFSTLALVGMIWLFVKRRPGALLVASVLCVFPAVFYLTYPPARYRHVLEPLLLICTLWALAQVREFKRLFPAD
jgi:4-amino-4-deoxy-L-arabinose transferase-like glycosyltransferase